MYTTIGAASTMDLNGLLENTGEDILNFSLHTPLLRLALPAVEMSPDILNC
jgi:hypothetical protein